MKITDISIQAKNKDRVNVSVDGKYRFSLDIFQVGELGIKVGKEYTDEELGEVESESQFGKLYMRALEYTLMRPHSAKEIRDYLWKKTRTTKYKSRKTGEVLEREGVSQSLVDGVYDRLDEKGYINDESFARYWVENRNQTNGSSKRKLTNELRVKGVSQTDIEHAFIDSSREDSDELQKIIIKKQSRYPDQHKFISYLMRQGFSYSDVSSALSYESNDSGSGLD